MKKARKQMRERRHRRVRAKVSGSAKRPRLCVFRSINHIYAQLIDDEKRKTLATVHDLKLKRADKMAVALKVGKAIAQKAKEMKIKEVVFDRGGYKYHGRVKALAEGAKKEGLKF